MTKTYWKTLLVLMCIALLLSCGKRNGVLDGDVFIVTRGGQNLKLGLVSIGVYSDSMVTSVIQRAKELDAARRDSIEAVRGKLMVEFRRTQAESFENRKEADSYLLAHGYAALKSDKYTNLKEEAVNLRVQGEFIDQAIRESYNLHTSSYYLSLLPETLFATKTDADGRFRLEIPRNGKFALAARSTRQVGDSSEDYHWLVWVSLNGQEEARVMLSNDNLTTSGSTESVVFLED